MARCMDWGCEEPTLQDSDQCEAHTRRYEREMAEDGYAEAPCDQGHYMCAHYEHGPCHGYLFAERIACPNEKCPQHELEPFDDIELDEEEDDAMQELRKAALSQGRP